MEFHPQTTGGAGVVVKIEDDVAESVVPAWGLLAQGFLHLSRGVIAADRGEFLALLREIPGDQRFAQFVAGAAIAKKRIEKIGIEPAINPSEGLERGRPGGVTGFMYANWPARDSTRRRGTHGSRFGNGEGSSWTNVANTNLRITQRLCACHFLSFHTDAEVHPGLAVLGADLTQTHSADQLAVGSGPVAHIEAASGFLYRRIIRSGFAANRDFL